MISTDKRLEYASGFIALGMVDEASDELEAIDYPDRLSAKVLSVRIDLYHEAKDWELLKAVAKAYAKVLPKEEKGWISHAFALRELSLVEEARTVLLEAEPVHGEGCATLHYNLACYHCLLGELEEAKGRLKRACKADASFKKEALDDPDLKGLWDSWSPAMEE